MAVAERVRTPKTTNEWLERGFSHAILPASLASRYTRYNASHILVVCVVTSTFSSFAAGSRPDESPTAERFTAHVYRNDIIYGQIGRDSSVQTKGRANKHTPSVPAIVPPAATWALPWPTDRHLGAELAVFVALSTSFPGALWLPSALTRTKGLCHVGDRLLRPVPRSLASDVGQHTKHQGGGEQQVRAEYRNGTIVVAAPRHANTLACPSPGSGHTASESWLAYSHRPRGP